MRVVTGSMQNVVEQVADGRQVANRTVEVIEGMVQEISAAAEGSRAIGEEQPDPGELNWAAATHTLEALFATLHESGPGFPVAVVGFFSVIALLLPDVGAMTWKEAQPRVPWDVFVLYGSGLSMGTALTTSGAAKWLASTLFSPLDGTLRCRADDCLDLGCHPASGVLHRRWPEDHRPHTDCHRSRHHDWRRSARLRHGSRHEHAPPVPAAVSNMPNAVAMGTNEITSRELNKTGAVMSILAAAFMSLAVVTYWSWIGLVG